MAAPPVAAADHGSPNIVQPPQLGPPSMEDAIYHVVTTAPAVAAILAGGLHPVDLPQNPIWPAACYTLITRRRHAHFGGSSHLARSRLQIDCFALTFDEVVALADAIAETLHAFKGLVTVEGWPDPVEVQGVFSLDDIDLPETVIRQSGPRVRIRQLEFAIWF